MLSPSSITAVALHFTRKPGGKTAFYRYELAVYWADEDDVFVAEAAT
jgi:hypothetical protein